MSAVVSWALFSVALCFFILFEKVAPRRSVPLAGKRVWVNLGLWFVNALLNAGILTAAGVGVALYAEAHRIGLGNHIDQGMLEILGGFVFLDLLAYLQHRIFHAVPLLWSIHGVHHTDVVVDATTAVRHHPVELLVGAAMTAPFILLFGLTPASILIYGGVAGIIQILHHSNLQIPNSYMNYFLVLPVMHEVHHSKDAKDANTNFSAIFPFWDHLFGTFRRSFPASFGVSGHADEKLTELLYQPVKIYDTYGLPLI